MGNSDVIIEYFETNGNMIKYSIKDENGCIISTDFDSYEEAWDWAIDYGFDVVDSFNL